MIKNISVSIKLWLIVLPAVLALVGLMILFFYRSNEILDHSEQVLYNEVYYSSSRIINADRDFYQAAIAEKELVLSPGLTNEEKDELRASYEENAKQAYDRVKDASDNLKSNTVLFTQFTDPTIGFTFEQLSKTFYDNYDIWLNSFDTSTGIGDMEVHQTAFDTARDSINAMTDLLDAYAQSESAQMQSEVQSSIFTTAYIVAAVIVFILILSTVIVIYLRKNIKYITQVNQKIAAGELSIAIDKRRISKDEIGRLCSATGQILDKLNGYVSYINEITQTLHAMADGDMRVDLKQDYAGEFKSVKDAFINISSSLGSTLLTIRNASEQVNGGATMISSGAQTLAGGTQEQASAVEELSATIGKVTDETARNLGHVMTAVDSMDQTLVKIDESTRYMESLLKAMTSIGDTSNSIKSVIKLIDDIAFQTNILALNAAVEAARAGQYGKGFAVVAAEVKNLAMKSANAANQTSDLIGSSISSVGEGVKIAQKTAEALADTYENVKTVSGVFSDISESTKYQAGAIKEIKSGISQISSVVLTNSATAEESASASEELSSQAELLYNEVARFRLSGEMYKEASYLLPKH